MGGSGLRDPFLPQVDPLKSFPHQLPFLSLSCGGWPAKTGTNWENCLHVCFAHSAEPLLSKRGNLVLVVYQLEHCTFLIPSHPANKMGDILCRPPAAALWKEGKHWRRKGGENRRYVSISRVFVPHPRFVWHPRDRFIIPFPLIGDSPASARQQ